MRISDWSSDVCSSDLKDPHELFQGVWYSDAQDPKPHDHKCEGKEKHTDHCQGSHKLGVDQIIPVNWLGHDPAQGASALFGIDCVETQANARSEENTSELQSLMRISYAVFCLKKKKNTKNKPRQRETN